MQRARFKRTRSLAVTAFVVLLSIVFFIPLSFSGGPVRTRVLFIGNSLTAANDLPRMVAWLAGSRQAVMAYETIAPGGYSFSRHASDPRVRDTINKGGWDVVVLQEQSQMPALADPQLESYVLPYARKLCQMIRLMNPRARIAFYMTMAKKNGDPVNAAQVPEVRTYEGMQAGINAGYQRMARQNHALVVPVGAAWARARKDRPDINLYADDTHPNMAGTYLAACVFYATLFKDTPVGLPHPQEINDPNAAYLQQLAEKGSTGGL